ncbi:MAG: glycosyltransferase, partial [Rhizobiales bacterium]|nr:glycosyltransferase [Hyphomicrobiales bacterium]
MSGPKNQDLCITGASVSQTDARRFQTLQSDLEPLVTTRTAPSRPLRVCILTADIFGPIKNGGIGSAYFHLARFLVEAGHQVTIAFVHPQAGRKAKLEPWIEYYRKLSIEFVGVKPQGGTRSPLSFAIQSSVNAYRWLKHNEDRFDMVHVSEWHGLGYYAQLAKHLGLAFQNIHFTVKCSSPTLWNQLGNQQLFEVESHLGFCFMECRSAELADTLISGSHHMLDWMLRHDYQLNQPRSFVQSNVFMPEPDLVENARNQPGDICKVDEIVFFGRLEPRKGLLLFCDALNVLARDGVKLPPITFLGGRAHRFNAKALIDRHKVSWNTTVNFLTGCNARQALEYLGQNNRLAVVASLLENSSIAVYECLAYRVPFVACSTGGTPELISEADRMRVLSEPHHMKMADLLKRTLTDGALVARSHWDMAEADNVWRAWHSQAAARAAQPKPVADKDPQPKVTVCVTHFNRRRLLQQALESIEAQTYPNIEVIVVDDGSTDTSAVAYLDEVEAKFADRGWRVIRQPNLYLGAARNTGARHATGELILFFDDDNIMREMMVETMVKAQRHCDADVLTSFAQSFIGQGTPGSKDSKLRKEIRFLGPAKIWSFFRNVVGDAACIVRRKAFEELGGYTEHYAIGKDDMEFYNRVILGGYKIEVVPEALYYYRISRDTMR